MNARRWRGIDLELVAAEVDSKQYKDGYQQDDLTIAHCGINLWFMVPKTKHSLRAFITPILFKILKVSSSTNILTV